MKVAVIGAGSTYTPELISGFISRKDVLNLASLCLMDIDRGKMEIVSGLIKRMFQANGLNPEVVLTENPEEAVAGTDYVLGQVRVGKLDARILDEKIPLKYGLLGQETTGPGGFMNALRTIPVIINIAKLMERLSPNAWLINFSNPSGIIAEAVRNNTGINMVGLCNGPINMIRDARKLVPEGTRHFDYDFVGLNHLCWITSIYADGKEILKGLINEGFSGEQIKNKMGPAYDQALLKAVSGLPIGYLNYYYFRDEQARKHTDTEKTRGEVCKEIEAELLELYKDTNRKEKPAELDKRGGALYSEAAVSLIDAIENDKNEIHVVDVKNDGAYGFMDRDDVVEVKCLVNKDGVTPVKLENFNDRYIIGLMKAVKAYEKLTVRAGLYGDYDAALAALMVHPLVGDYGKAKGVLDEMLEANRKYLPQYYNGV